MRKRVDLIRNYLKRYKIVNLMNDNIRIPILNKVKQKAIKNEGFTIIKNINEVFDKLDIKYFLDFGTLLGFVRENNFISHDLDIDIGIPVSDILDQRNIQKEMIKHGFTKLQEFEYKESIVEQSYMYNRVKVDLFYYSNDRLNSYCYVFYKVPGISYPSSDLLTPYKFTYKKILETEFRTINKIKYSVPKNPESVLVEKYGKNWSIPSKDWSYLDAPTISREKGFGRKINYN